MYKKIIISVVGFFIFSVTISFGQDFMKGGQGRQPMGDRGQQSLSSDIHELLNTEKGSATTSQNVQERYKKLKRLIISMIRSGMHGDTVLPKDEGQRIETLLKNGGLDEAAQKVHDAIMKLETVGAGQSDGGARQRRGQGQDTMQGQRGDAGRVVSSVPVIHLDIHQMANKNNLGNILKLMNPAIDSARRRLYISGSKSTSIGVVDIDKDELIETFDIGEPGGFLLLDSETGNLYLLRIGSNRLFRIDPFTKKAEEVSSLPSNLALPKKHEAKTYNKLSYTETGYPFEAGYLQEENAAYGVIVITDSSGRQVGNIKHGPDALYFDIDQKTGKLYATNTGDASIAVFDLNNQNRKVKDIDVGTSVDELALDPKSGGLYIRNRLGGSAVLFYDQVNKYLSAILNENIAGSHGIGMWPTQIIYDDGNLYVLSHYAGRIDVVNSSTSKITGSVLLKLSYKPRTDGISTMVMDRTRKIIYAAFPELGELAIADAKGLKAIKTLKIEGFDKTRTGPARIVLSVDEIQNKLYAYLTLEKVLQVYDGNTYSFERSIPVDAIKGQNIILSNPEKEILYVGNRIIDVRTLEAKGSFPRGERVIAYNNPLNRVYLVEEIPMGRGRMIERVHEFEDMTLKKEWTLSPVLSIPSSFAFDFKNNRFYVGYFEAAVVEAFDLTVGETPTGKSPATVPIGTNDNDNTQRPGGSRKGRCGDGICQPIEKERGVCPQDCGS